MITQEGYRFNVGIIICNDAGELLWARRIGAKNAWQFPQGGISDNEDPKTAMYRELKEELGVRAEDVELLEESHDWYVYHLPKRFQRRDEERPCIGQKQKWFLLRLLCGDESVQLDASEHPEFDQWRWVTYWLPLKQVIFFKQDVYRSVLTEFAPFVQPKRKLSDK